MGNVIEDAGKFVKRSLGIDEYKPDKTLYQPDAQESSLTAYLMKQAQGQGGPSPAELQMKQALDQQVSGAHALSAAQRGINPALAARLAQHAAAQSGQQSAQQSAILRAQEQLSSQGLAANMAQSQRQGRMGMDAVQAQAFQNASDLGQAFLTKAGKAMASGVAGAPAVPAASSGMVVPGQENTPGDHPENDTVHAMLSPGEIVVPKSVAQMDPQSIAKFVAYLKAKGGM